MTLLSDAVVTLLSPIFALTPNGNFCFVPLLHLLSNISLHLSPSTPCNITKLIKNKKRKWYVTILGFHAISEADYSFWRYDTVLVGNYRRKA
jgi:hypothetical protein